MSAVITQVWDTGYRWKLSSFTLVYIYLYIYITLVNPGASVVEIISVDRSRPRHVTWIKLMYKRRCNYSKTLFTL